MICFFLIATSSVTAQKTLNGDDIKNGLLIPYTNYFTDYREMVYTQFNKSQYLTGDDIWFTAWVFNPVNKQPLFRTSKLYVELWSAGKKLISRKILYIKEGTASNFMHVEDTLAPGTYCFRAYTNWMRNFYDDKDFNIPLTILGPTIKNMTTNNTVVKNNNPAVKETPQPITKSEYDIQFLPESGHFIEGVENVIGIKVTDNYGHGVLAKGRVFASDNKEIASYTTNQQGMTNFKISETVNTAYRSVIELPDGTSRELKLPQTEKQGVAINIKTNSEDEVLARLQINPLARALNQSYILMIHANGVTYHYYKINFTANPEVQFSMKKNDLANGIIYVTLFNEDIKPIAERVFYNQNTTIRGSLSLKSSTLSNDTIKLSVSASDSSSNVQIAKLSFSILPSGTLMNRFTTSLLAESRLRPALRGDIENPGYYFENYDSIHQTALDNLMMIKGWRKYDWETITKNVLNHYKYIEETGFMVNGIVKNWIKNKPELKSKVTLISPQNNFMLITDVDNDGKFSFNNLYLADSTNVIAAASSIGGANWNRVLDFSLFETRLEAPEFNQNIARSLNQGTINVDIPNMTKGIIRLGEVLITAKKKDPFESNYFVSIMSRKLEMNEESYNRFRNLEQLLLVYFNVKVILDANGNTNFDMSRGSVVSYNLPPPLPIMTVDGARISDPVQFLSFPISLIEAVAVDKSNTTGGVWGSNGVIAITIRKNKILEQTGDDTNLKRMTVKGYAPAKEFYEPKYLITPENPDFARYSTINWKPEVITDTTGKASFNIYVPHTIKSIFVRAEGINNSGLIFLHDEKITLSGRESNDN